MQGKIIVIHLQCIILLIQYFINSLIYLDMKTSILKIGGTRYQKLTETEIVILAVIVSMYGGLLLTLLGMLMK